MNRDTHELLTTAFGGATHPLALWYAPLLADGALRAFTAANATKIRKKVRHAHEAEALRDLQCELAVAAALAERRSPLHYEPLAAQGRRGPDFMVCHKGHTDVYVEVARLRPARNAAADPLERLAGVICGKLDQLASSAANLLVMFSDAGPFNADAITATLQALRRRAAAKDDAYFAFRGLNGARAFQHCLPRLSGILLATPAAANDSLYTHPQARHALPPDLVRSIVGWGLAARIGPAGAQLPLP
jgi:hypothetical protein